MPVPPIRIRITRSKKRQQLLSRFRDMRDEIRASLDHFRRPAVKEFEKVTDNWKNKPTFVGSVYVSVNGDSISLTVEPTGPNAKYWEWTSRGTKPHIITARNAPMLIFRREYTPKTSPGNPPTYGESGAVGGGWVKKLEVQHKGTRPRLFEEAIGARIKADFKREVENAIRRGLRKAG